MANESSGRNVLVDGRIVWTAGSLFTGRLQTLFGTQTPAMNQAGEQKVQYGFGLAVPKAVLNQTGPGQPGEIWAAIHEEAFTMFPSRQIPPGFAMKYKDGDGVDDQGKPFNLREGYAGHLVFALTTALPIKYYKFENGNNVMINEGIKCGDHVRVQVSVKAHGAIGAGKAGLYLNPNAVQFLGYGTEIISAPSGDAIFGMSAPPLPIGATAMPAAPTSFPGMPQAVVPPGYPPQAQGWQPPAAPQGPTPNYGVLPPTHQPPPGGSPMPSNGQWPPPYPQQPQGPAPVPQGYPPYQPR